MIEINHFLRFSLRLVYLSQALFSDILNLFALKCYSASQCFFVEHLL